MRRLGPGPLTLSLWAKRGVVYNFYGLGRLAVDPESNDRVWQGTPEREQAQDPERNGTGLIVDLVRVVRLGVAPESNFVMERAAT